MEGYLGIAVLFCFAFFVVWVTRPVRRRRSKSRKGAPRSGRLTDLGLVKVGSNYMTVATARKNNIRVTGYSRPTRTRPTKISSFW